MNRARFIILTIFLLTLLVLSQYAGAQSEDVECPTDSFIDVSEGSAGDRYAKPELNVTCDDETIVIESNGIIHYEYVAVGPGEIQEQEHRWEIPLNPEMADRATELGGGTVAVAVNGIPVWSPMEAMQDGGGDPYLLEMLDFCNGHIGPGGEYHYHARMECFLEEAEKDNVGRVLGYAFDGYPILAPYICEDEACEEIVELQSSWERVSDVENVWEANEYVEGSGDLDECNGMETEDGGYAYYATDTFPYLLGCFRGVVNPDLLRPAGQQQGGGQQPPGQRPPGTPPPGGRP